MHTHTVTEESPPARYWVTSEHLKDKRYIVDLSGRVWNGRAYGLCDCDHFQITCVANFERTRQRVPYALRGGLCIKDITECKHIKAAREHFEEHCILPMLAQMKDGLTE